MGRAIQRCKRRKVQGLRRCKVRLDPLHLGRSVVLRARQGDRPLPDLHEPVDDMAADDSASAQDDTSHDFIPGAGTETLLLYISPRKQLATSLDEACGPLARR